MVLGASLPTGLTIEIYKTGEGGAVKRSRLALGSLDTFHKFAEKQLLVYNFRWGEDAPYIIKERNWSLDALI